MLRPTCVQPMGATALPVESWPCAPPTPAPGPDICVKGDKKSGAYVRQTVDGRVVLSGAYRDGQPHGRFTINTPAGAPVADLTYRRGQLTRASVSYADG